MYSMEVYYTCIASTLHSNAEEHFHIVHMGHLHMDRNAADTLTIQVQTHGITYFPSSTSLSSF